MRRPLFLLILPIAASAAEPEPLKRLGSDRFRQAERVEAIAYSPDGKQLATADEHTIYLWDAADGRPIRTIAGHENRKFIALRFNADGTALFAVAHNEKKDVILYHLNPSDGKTVAAADVMGAGKDNFNEPEVRFSPDGAWVAARRGDKREVAVMDTATRKVVWSERQMEDTYHALAFRADSRVLAVGGWDGIVRLVDLKERSVTHQYEICLSAIWHLAFSPDGKDLVASVHAGSDADVIRFDAATGKERWKFRTHSAHDLFFTTDATAILYFGPERVRDDAYRWHWLDAATGKLLDQRMDTGWSVVDVRPDGKVMAIGGFHGLVTLWDLATRKRLAGASSDPSGPVTELRYTPDGTRVRGWSHGLYEWDVTTGQQTRLLPDVDTHGLYLMAVSPDQKRLGRIHRADLRFELIDLRTGRPRPVTTEREVFAHVCFRSDGQLVLRGEHHLSVVDPVAGKETAQVVRTDRSNLACAGDGFSAVHLIPNADHFHATRWDLTTGKTVGEWDGRLPDPGMMARSDRWQTRLSPDGQVLAVFFTYLAHPGMGFNRIEELHTALFDARAGRYLSGWWDLHTHADLAFSPDGRTVACFYQSVLGVDIREVMTGKRRTRRSNPPIHAAAFSPDGRTLALATQPGPVALWDLVGKPADWAIVKPTALWAALASADAEVAFDAIRHLRHHPTEAVALLKDRMKVQIAPAADWIAERIKLLDAAQFRDREKATADLAGVGELIVPELREALKPASAEARRRMEGLIEQAGTATPETWRAVRACEALEGIGTPAAREQLATWAKGPPTATLTREATESGGRLAKRGR